MYNNKIIIPFNINWLYFTEHNINVSAPFFFTLKINFGTLLFVIYTLLRL